MQLIDGRALAKQIRDNIKNEITKLGITPGLAVILVGADPASHLYVGLKEKACQEAGINFEKYLFSATEPQEKIIAKIQELNFRADIHGLLVQLPLPPQFDENKIIQTINPKKDLDGFHPENTKNLLQGLPSIIPPVASGIMKLIESTEVNLENKKATIVANSQIFAEPIKKLLEDKDIKAESISPDSQNLKEKTLSSDILIVAIGRAKFITADMIKDNAIIIDVGTNHVDNKVIGDVDAPSLQDKSGWLTPVPGGVGPVTVAMLLKNVLDIAKK